MNNSSKRTLSVVFILIMAILLNGCFSSSTEKLSTGEKNNEITIGWQKDVGQLNPHLYLPNQSFAQAMLYDALVEYGDNGEIVPSLAKSWNVSKDGITYTFHLREDVVYSDGQKFNAGSVKRNMDAIIANKKRHMGNGIMSYLQGVEVEDENTVVFRLSEPYYPILQELSLVRPFRFLGDNGFPLDGKTSEMIAKPIGTGPWVLDEYKTDEYAVFVPNERYWGEKPKLDKITVKVIPESESIVTAFENEELDLIVGNGVISMDNFRYLQGAGKYGVLTSQPMTTRTLLINSATGPGQDLKVRQAISHAIDKKSVVDNLTYGTEVKADRLLPTNFPYTNFELPALGYNIQKAMILLDEAGWKLSMGKAVREKDGIPLTMEFVFDANDAVYKPMAEVIQADLKKIGIDVVLKGEESLVASNKLKANEFHLFFWESYGAPYDPHTLVALIRQPGTGHYEALQGISGKEQLDERIKTVLTSTDEQARTELYKEILTRIHEEAIFVPITQRTATAVFQKRVQGVKSTPTWYDFAFESLYTAS